MLPELSHWFGIDGDALDAMPYPEIDEYLSRLKDLPPIGGTIGYQPKGG